MKIQALHQFAVTLSVTSSPAFLWARLTHAAIDAETVAEAGESEPVSPWYIPSLGMWRWDEGSLEIIMCLWQVGCRRDLWSVELSNLHREAWGSSWRQHYSRSNFLACFLVKSLKAGFSSALHLFPPLQSRCQTLANKCFHFVSSLCCYSCMKNNQPLRHNTLCWCQM